MLNNNALNTSQKIILLTAGCHQSDSEINSLRIFLSERPDWEFILLFSDAHGTAPLMHKFLKKSMLIESVPSYVSRHLQNSYYQVQSKNLLALNQLKKVLNTFNNEGIKTVLLKGMSSAEYIYKDLGLRPMGDVDILVAQDRLLDAERLLFKMGFKNNAPYKSYKLRTLNIHNHLNAFINNNITIELHHDLSSIHHIYKIPLKDVWENTESRLLENEQIYTLSLHLNLQFLSVHAVQHFLKKKIRLNSFVDISELIKMNYENINWDTFVKACKNYSITLPVYRALSVCKKYLHTDIPADILSEMSKSGSDINDEFIYLLNNRIDKIRFKTPSNYFKKIKMIDGHKNKLRYLWSEIFPSKDYIIYTYKLKHPHLYIFYYFYQFFRQSIKTFKNIINLIKRRLTK